MMISRRGYKWTFAARFRSHGFGWRGSRLACQRIREALKEISAVARTEPVLAGEGAVLLVEKLSPALMQVDSSTGALGNAVNRAVEKASAIVAAAGAAAANHDAWCERLFQALQDDEMPYLDHLGACWGQLCVTRERASAWADQLLPTVSSMWQRNREFGEHGYFSGTTACLASLLAAGRYDELLAVLELAPFAYGPDREYGALALRAQGKIDEALRYVGVAGQRDGEATAATARFNEATLLASGRIDEAYAYAFRANRASSNGATFRAIVKKYPSKQPAAILADLVRQTPGEEGKWFAAAKDAGLYAEAIRLAGTSPCDPRTLTRAARDFAESQPSFALGAGLIALEWLVRGHGYEITALDVSAACREALRAARQSGRRDYAREAMQRIAAADADPSRFHAKIIADALRLDEEPRQ